MRAPERRTLRDRLAGVAVWSGLPGISRRTTQAALEHAAQTGAARVHDTTVIWRIRHHADDVYVLDRHAHPSAPAPNGDSVPGRDSLGPLLASYGKVRFDLGKVAS